MVHRSVNTWLYFDQTLEDSAIEPCIASTEGSVDGWVCTQRQVALLGNTAQVIYIASTAAELNDLLHHNRDVFVPSGLAESIELLNKPLADYSGYLWVEDDYVSRYLYVNRRYKPVQTTLGFVGTSPEYARHLLSGRYSYICKEDAEATSISVALEAGVRDLWLHVSSASDIRGWIRRISGLVEAAEITTLFAGVSPAELERVWEQRLCLVARRSLPAGHRIAGEDFISAPISGGLSADMLDKVIGKRLRYPLSPQAVLTFGMLEC